MAESKNGARNEPSSSSVKERSTPKSRGYPSRLFVKYDSVESISRESSTEKVSRKPEVGKTRNSSKDKGPNNGSAEDDEEIKTTDNVPSDTESQEKTGNSEIGGENSKNPLDFLQRLPADDNSSKDKGPNNGSAEDDEEIKTTDNVPSDTESQEKTGNSEIGGENSKNPLDFLQRLPADDNSSKDKGPNNGSAEDDEEIKTTDNVPSDKESQGKTGNSEIGGGNSKNPLDSSQRSPAHGDEDDDYEPEKRKKKEGKKRKARSKDEMGKKKKKKKKSDSGGKRDYGGGGGEAVDGGGEDSAYASNRNSRQSSSRKSSSHNTSTTLAHDLATGMPTIEDVCSKFGLTDVLIEYTDSDFRNLMLYKLFQQHVRPALAEANLKVTMSRLMMLVAAKWRDFLVLNPYTQPDNQVCMLNAEEENRSARLNRGAPVEEVDDDEEEDEDSNRKRKSRGSRAKKGKKASKVSTLKIKLEKRKRGN
ncbi:chromodomain-helicase-DNA-binding protein Mi-2 homolog [Diachasma alloeum]|uniref:chromodomain-helicase-DNA-binding protein Mi-2 homolog n=1 Tax=Diachasma alloeum TaxID=454923 RepID=UPI00073824A0|nr:chromodomain-helicase-DNA-binding protein Mi-2 homolog [Diachasma alloeum]